ncbi:MAG: hypothetical protein JOY89_13295, partial [Solirubrobacterales bacterium]|nr:hypothetical protein [Solirubrobacterales bacterium]
MTGGDGALDVHQHLWPEAMIEALRERRRPPRLRGWNLELAGEPDYEVDPAAHDVSARAAQARADGLDLALVGLSSPMGIESLPADEARELLGAYHNGVAALPAPFGGWAAPCLSEIDPVALARELDRGFVGLQLPAPALLDADGYERVGPLLELLEASGKPLLVHPGPAAGGTGRTVAGGRGTVAGARGTVAGSGAAARAPRWWPAIVSYVQQMHAAWFAFRAYGRPRHP